MTVKDKYWNAFIYCKLRLLYLDFKLDLSLLCFFLKRNGSQQIWVDIFPMYNTEEYNGESKMVMLF